MELRGVKDFCLIAMDVASIERIAEARGKLLPCLTAPQPLLSVIGRPISKPEVRLLYLACGHRQHLSTEVVKYVG